MKIKKVAVILISLLCIIPTIVIILCMVSMSFMSGSQIEQYYGAINTGNNMMQYASLNLLPADWSLEQYKSIIYDNSDFLSVFLMNKSKRQSWMAAIHWLYCLELFCHNVGMQYVLISS